MASIQYLLAMRDKALAAGDRNQALAITADLNRLGWQDRGPIMETAVAPAHEQTVVKRRGRPKMPRCKHGNIADRCVECEQERADADAAAEREAT